MKKGARDLVCFPISAEILYNQRRMKPLIEKLKGRKAVCFLDLEGTQVSHEIIEIGAYKAYLKPDGTIRKIAKPFRCYVRPKHAIGAFVTKLTGITEKKLQREAVSYREMLNAFVKYLGKEYGSMLYFAYGSQDGNMFIASAENNMDASMDVSRFIAKNVFDFAEFLGTYVRSESNNLYSLEHICERFGIAFSGQAHDACDDAKNLLYLYQAVLARPDILAKEYKETLVHSPRTPAPLRAAMRLLHEKKTITEEDLDRFIEASVS